jgi:hypothetical protein
MGSPQKKKVQQQTNVRVVARIRPLATYEIENGSKQIVTLLPGATGNINKGGHGEQNSDDIIKIKIPTEPEVLQVQTTEKRWFELDAVLDGKSTQKETYIKSGAQQAVTKDIFKGFNCTILAYGQTGSGKTFTMGSAASAGIDDHDDDDDDDDASDETSSNEISDMDGIIPRACADLFNHIRTRCDGNAQVELSYLEIYNEEMRDLLVSSSASSASTSSSSASDSTNKPDNSSNKVVELKIRETLNGEVYVGGLSSRPVSSPKEIGKFMEEASKRRVTASTKMNAESSRSHAICVLQIKGVLEDSTKFQAKLTLVDLAGSERIKKTGAEGGRRQEGININKGLFVLGQVVSALSETRPKYKRKPPYRDSKLTRLLQDSLGGNSRTIMVACVSPADFNLDETITTLRYATNARNIKNTATRNVIKSLSPDEAAKLQRENQLLLAQVKELQETIRKMSIPAPALADEGGTTTLSSSEEDKDDGDDDDDDDDDDDGDGDGDEISMSKRKERIKELDEEVRQHNLKLSSLSKVPSQRIITESMAQDAIDLPDLHKQIATLEEEVAAKEEVEIENMELQEEMQNLKADADSARLAANKMSQILEQLQDLKGDEIDKKKMEHDHIKKEEAWVSFVFQVLQTNNEQLQKLQDEYGAVSRLFESPDFMGVVEEQRTGFMSKMFRRRGGNRPTNVVVRSPNNSNHEQKQQQQQSTNQSNNESDAQSHREGNAQNNSIQRPNHSSSSSDTTAATDETKQQQEQEQEQEPDDPRNIMKVIVNLKDELKAAHEVIRQQRVQVECAMQQKEDEQNNGSTTTTTGTTTDATTTSDETTSHNSTSTGTTPVVPILRPADSQTVPTSEYQNLKAKYTQLEIDRCWGEFQLRDRITNDSLKFHRRVRAVIQKANANNANVKTNNTVGGSGGSDTSPAVNNGGSGSVDSGSIEEEIKTKVDMELKQRLKIVEEHLRYFEERLISMKNHVSDEMNSLKSIRNSLRIQRDGLELEIGTSEIERHMITLADADDKGCDDDDDNDLLKQLTSLLVGPVKNLGSYRNDNSSPDNNDNASTTDNIDIL